jgi:hypothetical protein
MIGWLRSSLRRLSPRAWGIGLAVLVLAAAVLVFAPAREVVERSHRASPSGKTTGTSRAGWRPRSPVSAAQVARARRAARRFLAGFLRFAYGRGAAASVRAVTPVLGRELTRHRARVTPVEQRRRPRVVWLIALGQASGTVVAAALIGDGGITFYAVRLTLRQRGAGWLVSRVDGG